MAQVEARLWIGLPPGEIQFWQRSVKTDWPDWEGQPTPGH